MLVGAREVSPLFNLRTRRAAGLRAGIRRHGHAERDPRVHGGALARPTLDPTATTGELGAFDHRREPDVARLRRVEGHGVEPPTVVGDHDVDPTVLGGERDGDRAGLGVLARVGDRLLRDTEQDPAHVPPPVPPALLPCRGSAGLSAATLRRSSSCASSRRSRSWRRSSIVRRSTSRLLRSFSSACFCLERSDMIPRQYIGSPFSSRTRTASSWTHTTLPSRAYTRYSALNDSPVRFDSWCSRTTRSRSSSCMRASHRFGASLHSCTVKPSSG